MTKKEGFRASSLLDQNREGLFLSYSLQWYFERKPKILKIFIYIRMNNKKR